MITEQDLQEAIAECLGQRKPNAATCLKLASFYIIKHELYPEEADKPFLPINDYSLANGPGLDNNQTDDYNQANEYYSETDFGKSIKNKDITNILDIFDELMTALQVLQPRLYNNVLKKLNEL